MRFAWMWNICWHDDISSSKEEMERYRLGKFCNTGNVYMQTITYALLAIKFYAAFSTM